MRTETSSLKTRVYHFLEEPLPGERRAHLFNYFMVILILANVASIVLESVPEIEAAHSTAIFIFDAVSVMIFTVEYALRLWVAPEHPRYLPLSPARARLRYALSFHAMVDLLAIVPFYLGPLVPLDLRFLRILRILRLLKLTRYSAAFEALARVVYTQRRPLIATVVIAGMLLFFSASVIHLLEQDAQPNQFGSIPQAMWWTIVTMTTTGYGDVVPITPLGRMFAGLLMMAGMGLLALPTGILATGFVQEIRKFDFVVSWRMVASVPLFKNLDALRVSDIVSALKSRNVPARYAIVRRGEHADAMYFILSGDVLVDIPPEPKRLGPGDFFGEIALLKHGKRTATVVSETECSLLILGFEDFERLLHDIPELETQLKSATTERLAELERAGVTL
ncbi:MAG: cyclic nucleotide-binding domain-containing protein [Alphaproteobacteria bacterium]|nr:cyclic nucleotide-binding domain-containing protein [Alphaproteobacteria bacterium]